MEATPRELVNYETMEGDCPFEEWLESLDPVVVARIRARLNRVCCGNMGDVRPIGGGLSELRLKFGSGYRVYFASYNEKLVILLCGGDKGSQAKDIRTAKEFWQDFRRRNHA
jgi:putative addiction module killer protein